MAFTLIEQEIIVLRAVWDMVEGMVNYQTFDKRHGILGAELKFSSSVHQRLFNILLVDFLSKPEIGTFDLPEAVGPQSTDNTYLFYLRRICDEPLLNPDSASIRGPVEAFTDWLEGECFVEKVYFASIDLEADINVKRITFLKICGNIAKHNFGRLNYVVQRVKKVLSDNGVEIDEGKVLVALPDFYEWFHDDILNYHGTTIAEHLNNIRWGIFDYLTPEFDRSYEEIDPAPMYRFSSPDGCSDDLAMAMHWDLMNKVRHKPWFPQFQTADALKQRY